MKRLSTLIVLMLAWLLPLAAPAHHSRAMYTTEETTFEGTVKEFQYTNPHSWLIVDVVGADGKVVTWGFETLAPSSLMRLGIRKGDFPPGTKVKVKGFPLKDGRTAAAFIEATRADGQTFTIRSGAESATLAGGYAATPPPGVGVTATPVAPRYTEQERANLAVAMGFWENVFMARNPERAKDYLAADYIDHNPNLPRGGGLPAFVEFLNMVKKRFPLPEGVKPPSDIVLTKVDGELVMFIRKRTVPNPKDKSQTYDAFNFETFRVRDGKIVEHWDGAWSDIR